MTRVIMSARSAALCSTNHTLAEPVRTAVLWGGRTVTCFISENRILLGTSTMLSCRNFLRSLRGLRKGATCGWDGWMFGRAVSEHLYLSIRLVPLK